MDETNPFPSRWQKTSDGYILLPPFNEQYHLFYVQLKDAIENVDKNVRIIGKTGSGKDELAKFIHHNSSLSNKPIKIFNVGGLNTLVESTFFGSVKGSYTGSTEETEGIFSCDGTLVLSDLGKLAIEHQKTLNHVIQHREYTKVGNPHKTHKFTGRVIATTTGDKTYDEIYPDLSHRFLIEIEVDSFTVRKEDIVLIMERQLTQFNLKAVHPGILLKMMETDCSGNIRQLVNQIINLKKYSRDGFLLKESIPLIKKELKLKYLKDGDFGLICSGEKQLSDPVYEGRSFNPQTIAKYLLSDIERIMGKNYLAKSKEEINALKILLEISNLSPNSSYHPEIPIPKFNNLPKCYSFSTTFWNIEKLDLAHLFLFIEKCSKDFRHLYFDEDNEDLLPKNELFERICFNSPSERFIDWIKNRPDNLIESYSLSMEEQEYINQFPANKKDIPLTNSFETSDQTKGEINTQKSLSQKDKGGRPTLKYLILLEEILKSESKIGSDYNVLKKKYPDSFSISPDSIRRYVDNEMTDGELKNRTDLGESIKSHLKKIAPGNHSKKDS